jgi:hypothetical protein
MSGEVLRFFPVMGYVSRAIARPTRESVDEAVAKLRAVLGYSEAEAVTCILHQAGISPDEAARI